MELTQVEMHQNARILALFLIVQFAGLLLATQVFNGIPVSELQSATQSSSGYPTPFTFVLFYAGALMILTFILLILMRKGSTKVLLLFEAVAIIMGSFFFFLIAVSVLASYLQSNALVNGANFQLVVAGVLAVLLYISKRKFPRIRNFTTIVSSLGIGLIVGLYISFGLALLFMAILAVYDYIAVFITKHMVAMGQAAVQMNLALMVVTTEGEAVPARTASKEQLAMYSKQKGQLFKNYRNTMGELRSRKLVPLLVPRGLGNGDIAVPLMVAVSAYAQFLNFTVSLVVTIGATFGLILTLVLLKQYRRSLPAIPPLFFGIVAALLVYFIAIRFL